MPARRPVMCRSLTFTDLLVVLVLATFAVTAVAMLAKGATEHDRRIVCANNLRIIGDGLQRYSNDNKGNYPRTRYDLATADHPVAFTRPNVANPFADDGPGPNDVTSALYLL